LIIVDIVVVAIVVVVVVVVLKNTASAFIVVGLRKHVKIRYSYWKYFLKSDGWVERSKIIII